MTSDVENTTEWLSDLMLLEANASYSSNATVNEWNVHNYLTTHWGPKHLPMDVVIPITIVYILIFVSGVVGNIAVCVVIVRNPSMHTATNCYLFSLAVSDLTVLLFGLPNDLSVYWQQYPWALGEIVCKLRALIAEMTNYASVLTIVAFSLERYLAICHPLHAYTMAGLGRAARIVALIWLVALISALPFAIYTGISYVPYPPEAGANLSGQSIPESAFCALQDENPPTQWPLVEVATFIFFIVPMGILCLLYLRIGIRIRRTSLGRGRNVQGVVHHSNESRQSSSRRTILRMLVAVVIGFFICWAPFHAQRLLYVYAKDSPNYREINEKMFFITGCFYFFSSTINPILYNVMSVRYREAFRETLCGLAPASSRHHYLYNHHRQASDRSRFSANSRNGGSLNTSGIWLSTAERRSQRRASPAPQNGAVKETLIAEEKTTNVDIELDDSMKMVPSLANAPLRIGFVMQDDAVVNSIPATTPSNTAVAIGKQHPPCSSDVGLHHRTTKPAEWRVRLAHVKPKATNGGVANLPAGCTPLCLKSSQLVRRASETSRMQPTPGVANEQHQPPVATMPSDAPTEGHPLLTDFKMSSLIEPTTNIAHEDDPISAAVRDTFVQNTRRLS
ncbi:neuropeptides capa receptor-like [Daphnia carinata]|uniref:neuropeptides capa receptor-like n=1 Tax=Daphnia carinata TaxID=120202 RepID=UPI00257FA4F5|nr:neuropeptides capa receptor-like [Daphnia carinata]